MGLSSTGLRKDDFVTSQTTAAGSGASEQTVAILALFGGAIVMGLSPIFVRLAEVGPFAGAFWRVLLALPILYAWMRFEENGRAPFRHTRASLWPTLLAGLAFSGDLFFWHLSILNTSVANATFFATTAPVFVVIILFIVFRQRVARPVLAGLGLCLLGGAALIGESLDIAPGRMTGDLYGLGTAFFFGLYFIAVERARRHAAPARITFEATLVTTAVLAAVAFALEPTLLPRTGHGWAALVAMALISHAGGQGLLAVALGRLSSVFSSLVIFIEAIVAALTAWVVLGEAVSALQALGGAFILAGLWIARPRKPAQG